MAVARKLQRGDRQATRALAKRQDSLAVRAAGKLSEIADQPPLRALCIATIGWAAVRRDPRLAAAGARMLAAHTLATWFKTGVKRSVDRNRPDSPGDHEIRRGGSDQHDLSSFPSGHTAGAVAVAEAFARDYPEHATKARIAAAAVSLVQVPRAAHFIGDVLAGALIGLAAEKAVAAAARNTVAAVREGYAPFTVARSPGSALRTPPATAARPRS